MTMMKRYAVYYAPRPGEFADRAAAWLGWDAARGCTVAHPEIPGLPVPLADLTAAPRKYGFHGTLRAPFRPAPGLDEAAICQSVARLASGLAPVECGRLDLVDLHGFLALVPGNAGPALQELGASVVRGTNDLRAPLTPEEIAKRRPESLTEQQRGYLDTWGYPHIFEEFTFHLTLSGRLEPDALATTRARLADHIGPVLPRPFVIEDLCLFGEDDAGRCHILHRYPLSG